MVMEDARIRAFSRSLGSNIRTLSLPLLIAAAFYAASDSAKATPECANLGAGDPMTAGNDTCTVTITSPLATDVDALAQGGGAADADTIKLDATTGAGGSFSFDLSHISSAPTGGMDFRGPSASRRHRIENAHMQKVPDSAVCVASRFTGLRGMWIFGMQDPTKKQAGTPPVWSRGNSGMRRMSKQHFCGDCRRAAAHRAADASGSPPKSITASRCFRSGPNTGPRPGRSCCDIGACPICN